MTAGSLIVLTIKISVIGTVFGFGLTTTIDDLLYVVRRPRLLARSLLSMLVVVPTAAVALVRVFDFPHEVEVALVALSISPVPPLLPKREAMGGGLPKFALGLMAVVGLLSIVVLPLLVWTIATLFNRPFSVGTGAIAGLVLKVVMLPLAAGMVLKAVVPTLAARAARPVNLAGTALLIAGMLPLLVGVAPAMRELLRDGAVMAIAVFVAIGLTSGHLLGGPEPYHAVVLALSSACRHPAIALAVAAANFPEERFTAAIVLYMIVNALITTPYLMWRQRVSRPAT